jgi:hypothetical protein
MWYVRMKIWPVAQLKNMKCWSKNHDIPLINYNLPIGHKFEWEKLIGRQDTSFGRWLSRNFDKSWHINYKLFADHTLVSSSWKQNTTVRRLVGLHACIPVPCYGSLDRERWCSCLGRYLLAPLLGRDRDCSSHVEIMWYSSSRKSPAYMAWRLAATCVRNWRDKLAVGCTHATLGQWETWKQQRNGVVPLCH